MICAEQGSMETHLPLSSHLTVLGCSWHNNSYLKKEQSYNLGSAGEHQEALPTCMVLPGLRQIWVFRGVQSRGHTSRERLQILRHTQQASPFHCGPRCFRVNDAAPEHPRGSLGKRDTRGQTGLLWKQALGWPFLDQYTAFCLSVLTQGPEEQTLRPPAQASSLSEALSSRTKKLQGREAGGCQGSAEESQASALVQG